MSQTNEEQVIRALEKRESEAVIKGDTATLFKELWAAEFLVNNPANLVVNKQQVKELIQSGKINYESFERIIEAITIVDQTAIVMGREEVKPQGLTDHSGKSVVRRFSNVWIKQHGKWRLLGRQATISSIQ